MKKTFFAALALLLAFSASAQLRYGVKGGFNMSNFKNESITIKDVSGVSGWQAGFMAQYKVMNFSIQPEINFSVTGGDLDNTSKQSGPLASLIGDNGSMVKYRTNNIEVPINLQYGIDLGSARVFAQAGPVLNFVINGTVNGSSDVYNDIKDEWGFTRSSLGFGIGAGAELGGFQLTLRYTYAGKEIGEEYSATPNSVNVNPFNEITARNLSLSLGYFF